MAASVNKVILIGNLGRDPEIRRNQAGEPIANLRIATSETWKDKATGDRKERTEWHTVVIFNEALAKVAEQYLRKGAKVYIEGQLQTRKWTDKDGIERYTTEVVLQRFRGELTMLESQRNGPPPADDPDQYGTTSTRDSSAGGNAYADRKTGKYAADLDDDIPF
ncbi:single-stranded DNA-binding protein [Chelatococcus asaccharovorans]|uniref:single-stranded DNA-binding protein n=1 Tax=Chelatococcus asaccharovorans TaxID=28210 RepID=UPI00224C71DE|nr:single-stranded DNA-binding protein [Chelatococcus asaccharovorans]CAH1671800.1 Single-stranded DNA-binding protein [Chelatococcus asaccharovorans]CAH1676789.1 Single-stranded DNA-binding protein [Chelatococcus asaccharovorans]